MDKGKAHILFVITSLRFGGAERVVVNLTRFLARRGLYRVTIMLLEESTDFPIPEGVEVVALRKREGGFFSKLFALPGNAVMLKRFVLKNGVDVAMSFMQRPNVVNLLSKVFGSPHVPYANVRVCLREHYKSVPGIIRAVARRILRWLWRYAEKTVGNSRVIKEEVISLLTVDPSKVEVIYNPLDIEEIRRLIKEPVDEEWLEKKKEPVIINVARLTRAKGQAILLRAVAPVFARRPGRLIMVGDGEYRHSLKREAERLGISSRVAFVGQQGNPYKYLARSDIFVISSLYEGFPNAVIEAMVCGCPVISTNCLSGPAEIMLPPKEWEGDVIEAQYGILVNGFNETTLAEAIEYLLDRDDLKNKYAALGPERAERFDISDIGADYEEALTRCLKDVAG